MDFTLGDDRQALVDTLERLFRERYSVAVRRQAGAEAPGHSSALWAQLAEVGAVGMLFPPEAGGFGGTPFDIMAVFEALGRANVAAPMLQTLMAGSILVRSRTDQLEAIVEGRTVVAVGFNEAGSRYDWRNVAARAVPDETNWSLDGTKSVVLYAEAAHSIVVSARDPDGHLAAFLVAIDAPGVVVRGYATVDGLRAADVTLAGVKVPREARVGEEQDIADAVAWGTLALSAEGLGLAETLQSMTLDYLKTRVQFGSPIGRNQVLQHRMVDLLVETEQARSSVINAAGSWDASKDDRDRALAAAKYTLGKTTTRVAEEAIQMHGGIGMTNELDLSHFAKSALMIDHQLGDSDHQLARYMTLSNS